MTRQCEIKKAKKQWQSKSQFTENLFSRVSEKLEKIIPFYFDNSRNCKKSKTFKTLPNFSDTPKFWSIPVQRTFSHVQEHVLDFHQLSKCISVKAWKSCKGWIIEFRAREIYAHVAFLNVLQPLVHVVVQFFPDADAQFSLQFLRYAYFVGQNVSKSLDLLFDLTINTIKFIT